MRRRPLREPGSRTVAACWVLALATAAVAGSSPAAAERSFGGRTDVVEVRVPVNVVARDGEPVRGLTAEDFEVYDRGKRQEVVDLEVIDLELLEVAEDTGSATLERMLPSSARRHFLLLFDLSFSSPSSVRRAREAAREVLLNSLHPTDLAAVAVFSIETGPELLVTFTPDRAQLARAIDLAGSPRAMHDVYGRAYGSIDPLRFLISEMANEGEPGSSRGLDTGGPIDFVRESDRIVGKQMARQEKAFSRGKISVWATYMGQLAKLLDSVEGRKHVIYFSEGFDGRLMLGRQPRGDDLEAERDQVELAFGNYWMVDMTDIYGDSALQSEVGLMLEELRRADCVIQAVDISGLRAATTFGERARQVDQDVLFYIANDTGGELFEDTNNFDQQLDRVLSRSTVTYVLTFRPSKIEADGSYHPLKVKADLPRGARLSHRAGYYAPRAFEELHPLEKSLLASDAIASAARRQELAMNVLAAPFRAGEEAAYVPVIVEIDGEDLLDDHRGKQMSVELYAYATDEKGEIKAFFTQVVSLDLSRRQLRSALEETGLKYYGHLELPTGRYLARVLARNASTGRTGVESLPIEIPAYGEAGGPVLLPPFFPEPPGRWLLVRERDEGAGRSIVYPFTVDGQPYVPAAKPDLVAGEEVDLYLVAYNLGDGDLTLDGKVLTADGRELDAPQLALVERTVTGIQGLDKLLATFRPAGLERGDYTLRVALTHAPSGARQASSLRFSVLR